MDQTISIDDLAGLIAARRTPGAVMLAGVTGSVAAGKSTLTAALARALWNTCEVDHVSTDGFLLPNAVLAARDLLLRKGFPESYDADAFVRTLAAARVGPVTVPGYSHTTYDVDHDAARTIDGADIVIFEGLGFAPFPDGRTARDQVDALIYVDADEGDLETWYVARFMGFWRAAENDPASFYAQFRSFSEPEADAFARRIWQSINLPNLRDHISRTRDDAHILVRKRADHSLALVRA